MSNNKLTDYAVIDTKSGEVTQYLTSDEKDILDKKYTSANPNNTKNNDADRRKNSESLAATVATSDSE